MKKKLLALIVASMLVAGLNSVAGAVVIDFNEIDNTGPGYVYSGYSLNSKGFNFRNSLINSEAILHWQRTSPYNADPNGTTYSQNYGNTLNTLTRIGGGTFDLNSLDIGNVYNIDPYVQNFSFTGHQQGGTTFTQTFTSDSLPGLQTVVLNWTNLDSFVFTEASGIFLQADNFVIDQGTAPVPEPSTFFLLGAGLGGFALYRRRRVK